LTVSFTKRPRLSLSTFRALAALIPPCAATLCARRGASWKVNDAATGTWIDWTPGVPQTNAGDLKMVTEWWRLPFVIRNAAYDFKEPPPQNPPPYLSIERTKR